MEELKMYKLTKQEIDELILEYQNINDLVILYEGDIAEYRKGSNRFVTLDDIHIIEEQLHYMRGYLRIVKIRLAQQGVNV